MPPTDDVDEQSGTGILPVQFPNKRQARCLSYFGLWPVLAGVFFGLFDPCAGVAAELTNDTLKVTISEKTGQIERISGVRDGVTYVTRTRDRYEAEGTKADEDGDVATAVNPGSDGQSVLIACVHTGLGLNIEKKYALAGGVLSKETKYTSAGAEPKLVDFYTELEMDKTFRDGTGYYYEPIIEGHQGPRRPFTLNTAVTQDVVYHPRMVAYYAKAHDCTIGQYLYRRDSRLESPFGELKGKLTLTGWALGLGSAFLGGKQTVSFTTRFTVVKGDPRFFDDQYLALPEFAAFAKVKSPEWVGKVACWGGIAEVRSLLAIDDQQLKSGLAGYLKTIPEGEYGVFVICNVFSVTCDFPAKGLLYYGDSTDPSGKILGSVKCEEFKKIIARIKAISPKIKIGFYTWPWQVYPDRKSAVYYQEHPDRLVRDRNGNLAGADKPDLVDISAPGCAAYRLDQYRRMLDDLGADFLYMDAAPGEAINWGRKTVGTNGDWIEHYRQVGEMARQRNAMVWQNNVWGVNVYSDMGIFEYTLGFDKMEKRDWRTLAALSFRTALARRYRRAAVVIPMWGVNLPYAQHTVGYGTPLDLHSGSLNIFHNSYARLYHRVSAELRDAWPSLANLTPSFWKLETPDLETAALQKEQGHILTAIWHGKEAAEQILRVPTADLHLQPGRDTFRYHIRLLLKERNLGVKPAWHEDLADIVTAGIVNETGPEIETKIAFSPKQQHYITFTQVPGVVYAVDGARTILLLPEANGVRIAGSYPVKAASYKVTVDNGRKQAQVLLHVPVEWQGAEAQLDGAKAPAQLLRKEASRFLLVKIPTGKHEVEVRSNQAPPSMVEELRNVAGEVWAEQFDPDLPARAWTFTGLDHAVAEVEGYCAFTLKSKAGKKSGAVHFNLTPGKIAHGFALSILGNGGTGSLKLKVAGWEWEQKTDFTGWRDFKVAPRDFKPLLENSAWPADLTGIEFKINFGDKPELTIGDIFLLKEEPAAAGAQTNEAGGFNVKRVSQEPTLDGKDIEDAWRKAEMQKISQAAGGEILPVPAEVRLLYDDQYLYCLARCPEAITREARKLDKPGAEIKKNSNVTLLLQPDPGRPVFYELVLDSGGNVLACKHDEKGAAEMKIAIQAATAVDYNVSWILEAKIPLADLGAKAAPGVNWRINLGRHNACTGELSSWRKTADWLDVRNFGTLAFE